MQNARLKITGMSCTACSANIQKRLKKQDGVKNAEVFFLTHSAKVEFDSEIISLLEIISMIEKMGYGAKVDKGGGFVAVADSNIKLGGVRAGSLGGIKGVELRNFKGVERGFKPKIDRINEISFAKKDSDTPLERSKSASCDSLLLQDSNAYGFLAKISRINDFIESKILTSKTRLALSIILSMIILFLSMIMPLFQTEHQMQFNPLLNAFLQLFITLCVMHLGRGFYFRGLKSLFFCTPNMDSLVALGSLSGFFYSLYNLILDILNNDIDLHNLYFEGVCVIITFVMLGKFIEESAKNKAMSSAEKLLAKRETKVYKILNYSEDEMQDLENPQNQHLKSFFLDSISTNYNSMESRPTLSTLKSQSAESKATKSLKTIEISPDDIRIGDYLQVLEHSFVPVDSVLIEPKSGSIDESILTGESLPVCKNAGEKIAAGILNLESTLTIRAISTTQDSTIAKMKALIINAYESKSNIATLADKISGVFVPLVIFLSIISFVFWLSYADFDTAISHFASTLLISCPCALGLATPMAMLFANARANKIGIFFKDAKSLERISKCDYAVFDKTGTLTKREFEVANVETFSDFSPDMILKILASIEKTSTHILANSICKEAQRRNISDLYRVIESKSIINRGIKAQVAGCFKKNTGEEIDSYFRYEGGKNFSSFILGSEIFMRESGVEMLDSKNIDFHNQNIESMRPKLHTTPAHIVIYLAIKTSESVESSKNIESSEKYTLIGKVSLRETLKDDAKELVKNLKTMGITCEILSGDSKANVMVIANELGLEYSFECTPQDKFKHIKSLQSKGAKVLMIGDGSNDALALSAADVSLVMSSGTHLSLESGDIIYFSERLSGVREAFALGRVVQRNIKQNLSFAFAYNVVCIPVAMGVLSPFFLSDSGVSLSPMIASIAMSLSSISVVANASRVYGFRT